MRTALVAFAVAVLATTCGSSSTTSTQPDPLVVEVFTLYRGDDARAFEEVLRGFEEATGHRTVHVGTADLADRIQQRVNEADPPDVALLAQPGLVRALADADQVLSVDSLDTAIADDVRDSFPDLLDAVTIDDELYAVPWRIDVKSLVWYRPDVLEARGYEIPEDFSDLEALVSDMSVDGDTPWCLTMGSFEATGWVGTDWIEDIVLRTQGLRFYDQWATGQVRFDDDRVRDAMQTWQDLALGPDRFVGTPRTVIATPWQRGGDPLLDDDPGCLLHRQLGGYATELPDGTTIGPDGDLDFFVMPGADADGPAPLLLSGELAVAFTAEPGVAELVEYLARADAGAPWAAAGGFVSPHRDVDPSIYGNEVDRRLSELVSGAEIRRFDGADTMPPGVGVGTFWTGVVHYVATRDLDATTAIIDAGFDDPSVLGCGRQGPAGDC